MMMNRSRAFMIFHFLFGIFFVPCTLHAMCSYVGPSTLDFFLSRSIQNEPTTKSTSIQIRNCQPGPATAFLMLGFGANELSLTEGVITQHYAGLKTPERCEIIRNPFSIPLEYKDRQSYYEKKTRFLRSCMEIVVEDPLSGQLNFPDLQSGCIVTRLSPTRARIQGGYCFLEIHELSFFDIQIRMNPQCRDSDFLASKNIEPMDVPSQLNFFTAGDATGSSGVLAEFAQVSIRSSVDPSPELLPGTEEPTEGLPRWPSLWTADLHMGRIEALEITIAGDLGVQFLLSFYAENRSRSYCSQGHCEDPSQYSLPFSGELSLFQIKESQRKFLGSSVFGSVLLPRWQGEVKITPGFISVDAPLELHGTYEWQAVFTDPYEDYFLHDQRQVPVIPVIPNLSVGTSTSGQILPILPSIQPIIPIAKLPRLPGMERISAKSNIIDTERIFFEATAIFRKFGNNMSWPPYYYQICSPDSFQCKKITDPDSKIVLITRFLVNSKDHLGNFNISFNHDERRSKVLGNYLRNGEMRPEVSCH